MISAAILLDWADAILGRITFRKRPLVMVIDDDKDDCNLLTLHLQKLRCRVKHRFEGQSAIDSVDENGMALLMIDLNLPGASGIEVFKRVRRVHPELPLVVMSGNIDYHAIHGLLGLGCFSVWQKPRTGIDLRDVRQILQQHGIIK